MSDYLTLIGVEQIQNAGRAMLSAAEAFQRAASEITIESDRARQRLSEHQAWMDVWLARFEAVVDRLSDKLSLEREGQILYAEPDPRDPPRSPPPPMEGPAPVTVEGDVRQVTETLLRPGLARRTASVEAWRGGRALGEDPPLSEHGKPGDWPVS